MGQLYLLEGVIEYSGSYHLGVFTSLDLAIAARVEFRRQLFETNGSESFDSYSIYDFTPGELVSNVFDKLPLDTFIPSWTKT
jgi:hypothetical protein